MTRDLKEMAGWLESKGVQAIALEATGVYWKPVWNILEAAKKFELLLVNAQHILGQLHQSNPEGVGGRQYQTGLSG